MERKRATFERSVRQKNHIMTRLLLILTLTGCTVAPGDIAIADKPQDIVLAADISTNRSIRHAATPARKPACSGAGIANLTGRIW